MAKPGERSALTITAEDRNVEAYARALQSLGDKDGHRAMARAINRVVDMAYTRVVRAVSQQSSIKQALVRRDTGKRKIQPGRGGDLEGQIRAYGWPIPLREFGAVQFKTGVRARVFGKLTRFPGTFINAGRYYTRNPVGAGHVFQRTTADSLPIERQDGPAVATELVRGRSADVFQSLSAQQLPIRIRHELSGLLPTE